MIELITTLSDGSRYTLDLNKSAPIALSKNFLDLKDFTKRKGDFSKSFDLPRTKRNDYYFGLFGDPSSLGGAWSPQYLSECWLLEDSNIVIEGALKLVSTDPKHNKYTVLITGQISTIKNAIGDKSMSDLDMSAWSYTPADISDSWDGSFAGGHVIFSINDNGFGMGLYKKKDSANALINITDSACQNTIILDRTLPAFRLNELLRKIFNESGFKISGSWFGETYAEDIYVQSDNPLSEFFENLKTLNAITKSNHTVTTSYTTVPLVSDPSIADWNDITHQYVCPVSGAYHWTYRITLTGGEPKDVGSTFQLQKNGTSFFSEIFATSLENYELGGSLSVSCNAGDVIRMQIKDNVPRDVNAIVIPGGAGMELVSLVPTTGPIDPSEHLANYKQIDFLREIIGIFNLIIWKPKQGEIRLDTWGYYMKYYGSRKDWSDKVDMSTLPLVKPINSELTNPINLELKRADDILNAEYIKVTGRSYGSYREDTRIPFTQKEDKPFSIFAPAPYQEIISSVPAAENLNIIVGKLYESEDNISFKPPGLQLVYYCGTYVLYDGPSLYTRDYEGAPCVQQYTYPVFSPFRLTSGGFPYSGSDWKIGTNTLSLNFAWFTPPSQNVDQPATINNLYNRHFREMLRERYDTANKIIEFNAILTPSDISNFNFADTIIINLNGTPIGLKILEIIDYSPNVVKSTKIKSMISFIQ